VTYTTTDSDDDPLDVTLAFSTDGGELWQTFREIKSQPPGRYSVEWPDVLSEGHKLLVRVTASDLKGEPVVATSSKVFGATERHFSYENHIESIVIGSCANTSICHGSASNGFNPEACSESSVSAAGSIDAHALADRLVARAVLAEGSPMPPTGLIDSIAGPLKFWAWQNDPCAAVVPPPSFSFIDPATTVSSPGSDNRMRFVFSFQNAAGWQWHLYAVTAEGATSGGTLLSGGNYISTTTFEWKTDQVANGTYFFYVRFTNGQSVHTATGGDTSVIVNNSGNKLPVVKLKGAFKVGSITVRDDQDQTISYDVTDEDPDSVLTVKLEYSIDNGTWLQVTEQSGVTPGTGKSIVWPAAQISESPLYKVRIRVIDNENGIGVDGSNQFFGATTRSFRFDAVSADVNVKEILARQCNSCHSGANDQRAQTNRCGEAGNANDADSKAARNWMRMKDQTMPPGGGNSATDWQALMFFAFQGAVCN
jgi:hypothetical protein